MNSVNGINLRRQLKYYLVTKNISAAELARRSGINKQSISNWLGGIEPKSFTQVKRIADVLGLSIDELLFGDATRTVPLSAEPVDSSFDCVDHSSLTLQKSAEIGCILNPNGFFREVSPAFCTHLGWKPEELLSRPAMEFVHPSDRQRTFSKVVRPGKSSELTHIFDTRLLARNGRYVWFRFRTLVAPLDGVTFSMCQDLTGEHPAEIDSMICLSLNALIYSTLNSLQFQISDDFKFDLAFPNSQDVLIHARPHQLSTAIAGAAFHLTKASAAEEPKCLSIDVSTDSSQIRMSLASDAADTNSAPDLTPPGYHLGVVEFLFRASHATMYEHVTSKRSSIEVQFPLPSLKKC